MNNGLWSSIILHDYLHGLRNGRGVGTETLEENLAQDIAGLCHAPLLQVFMDVRKAYDSLERGRCMEILKGYGLRTNLQRLLHRFWDDQAVVLKTGRYYGRPFRTERGVTQGGPPPPPQFSTLWWMQW